MSSVSVLIPAFNSEKFIKRSIESVLSQTVPPSELIVIDDGSTDSTASIASSYGGIVRVISRGRNCGLPAARNFGIENASGEWIAFLDSDDEWEPRKNEIAIKMVEGHATDWCMVAQRRVYSHDDNAETFESMNEEVICDKYFSLVLDSKSCCPSSIMVRKRVFERLGGFNEQLSTGEDLEMWWRIANDTPLISYYTGPLVKYYVDVPGSMTNSRRNEAKLIAFWDAVMRITCTSNDPVNAALFVEMRNAFASKAVRYYLRDGYYTAADHLMRNAEIDYHPLMKVLFMLPNALSGIICMALYNAKKKLPNRIVS